MARNNETQFRHVHCETASPELIHLSPSQGERIEVRGLAAPRKYSTLTLPSPLKRARRQTALRESFIVYRKIQGWRRKHNRRPPTVVRQRSAAREFLSLRFRSEGALASPDKVSR